MPSAEAPLEMAVATAEVAAALGCQTAQTEGIAVSETAAAQADKMVQ